MTKLTALPHLTPLSGDDLLYGVNDPSGSPSSSYLTAADVANWVLPFYNARMYGAVPDAFFADGVANGTTTFTSNTANFVSTDVGKTIKILNAGTSGQQDNDTTIASVSNSTTVVLTNGCGRSQTNCRFYISRDGDQLAHIQAAIDAATPAGGMVYLPAGGYLVSGSVVLKSRVSLEGAGPRATLLHLGLGANSPLVVNDTTLNNYAQHCGVRNMFLTGARNRQTDITTTLLSAYTAGDTTVHLTSSAGFSAPAGSILIGTNRIRYQGVTGNDLTTCVGGVEGTTDGNALINATVTQHRCHGIMFQANPYNAGPLYTESYDPHMWVENVVVKDIRGDGVCIWGQSESRINNVWVIYADHFSFRPSFDTWIDRCTADTGGRAGYYIWSSETRLSNCKAFYCGGNVPAEGWGFFFEGPASLDTGQKIGTCLDAQDNKAGGYYLRRAQRIRLDGIADSNSTSSAGTYPAILLDGSTNCIIDLMCVDRTGAGATQQNAIQLLEN